MRKNNFIEGAFIATLGIVICKFIGLIYVIPFYALIGKSGGVLYSYAYSIYVVFLNMSTSGIPLAISKIVSEYNSLGLFNAKERAYKIGFKILMLLGIFFFLILMIFAPHLAKIIIGNTTGWTVKDVAFVIRIVSTALLVVPLLSVTKGYFQGHKIITVSSVSNILEQLIRVFVILLGSYLTLKVFNLSLKTAIGVSVFAATIGALGAYLYLVYKMQKNKEQLNRNSSISRGETKITDKSILKKLVFYALPFVLIELLRSAYTFVDISTVVRSLTKLGYSLEYSETVFGVVTTWGNKINMIIISLALGFGVSLIPNITGAYIKKDYKTLNKQINQTLSTLIYISIPLAIIISFFSNEVWLFFYGKDTLSATLFSVFVFQSITYSIYGVLIDISQSMNKSKLTLGTLGLSFILKLIFNILLINVFHYFNIKSGYGVIVSTFIAQISAIVIIIYKLSKDKIVFKETFKNLIETVLCSLIMLLSIMIINSFIDYEVTTRFQSIVYLFLYGLFGMIVYLFLSYKSKLMSRVININFFKKFNRK